MTTTDIQTPGIVTTITTAPKRSIAELAAFAVGLLVEDLPQPVYLSVSQSGQEISLLFPGDPGTSGALAQWADRFGGTLTGEPYTRSDGQESVHCQVKFITDGVTVEAYAFIIPDEVSATTC